MRTSRSRAALTAAATTTAAFALTSSVAASAVASPYTPNALLTISTTNPLLGGTLTITILNFDTGELIDIKITGVDEPLTTVKADKNGSFSTPISLPGSLLCEQTISATGRESGKTAASDLLIGSLSTCGEAASTKAGASYASATPTSADQSPAVAAAAVAGLAAVGGAGFLVRRRRSGV